MNPKRTRRRFTAEFKAEVALAATEEQRLIQEVIGKADAFMRTYGEQHGYDIVFAATEAGTIVYGRKGVNITDEVIKGLNQ